MDIDVTTHDRDSAAVAANQLAALLIARVRALNLANRGAEPDLSVADRPDPERAHGHAE